MKGIREMETVNDPSHVYPVYCAGVKAARCRLRAVSLTAASHATIDASVQPLSEADFNLYWERLTEVERKASRACWLEDIAFAYMTDLAAREAAEAERALPPTEEFLDGVGRSHQIPSSGSFRHSATELVLEICEGGAVADFTTDAGYGCEFVIATQVGVEGLLSALGIETTKGGT
jgi:hypothetical protein